LLAIAFPTCQEGTGKGTYQLSWTVSWKTCCWRWLLSVEHVTGDESWFYHFNPKTMCQCMEWHHIIYPKIKGGHFLTRWRNH
jgi:hypothetical protein